MRPRHLIIVLGPVFVTHIGCERSPTSVMSNAKPSTASAVSTGTAPDLSHIVAPTPNILLVMIDTLRADRVGAYGNRDGLTPHLDALATESLLFECCRAPAPWTQPSIASLFCGRYPGVHRVTDFVQAVRQTVLGQPKVVVFNDRFITLAEWLKARGYATAKPRPFFASFTT